MPRAGRRRKGGQAKSGKSSHNDSIHHQDSLNDLPTGLEAWQDIVENETSGPLLDGAISADEGIFGRFPPSGKAINKGPSLLTKEKSLRGQQHRVSHSKSENLFSSLQSPSSKTTICQENGIITDHRMSFSSIDSTDEVILFRGRTRTKTTNTGAPEEASEHEPKRSLATANIEAAFDDYLDNVFHNRNADGQREPSRPHKSSDEAHRTEEQNIGFSMPRIPEDGNGVDQDEWGSTELQDFDELSTASELLEAKPRILRIRSRGSVMQYLAVAEDEATDHARWLRKEQLRNPDAAEIVLRFEERAAAIDAMLYETEDSSDDGSELPSDGTEDDDDGDWENEKEQADLLPKVRMTDEQMARLLSKQQELGIMGDELVLYTGEGLVADSSADEIMHSELLPADRMPQKTSAKGRKIKDRDLLLDEEDLFGLETYGDFDVMDFDRPSLKQKNKKEVQWESLYAISDPELRETYSTAWHNDRKKKKVRKQQREELRAQGLLTRNGKPDLKAKYSKGMTVEDIKVEIKRFLMSSTDESLALPPLQPNKRKMVHDLANRLDLKSKSQGSGPSRFPILYKRGRSRKVTEAMLASLDAMYTPRRAFQKSQKRDSAKEKPRGGGVRGAASYRDGEVVGIGAPELGKENRGRAMLEKMGWSNGTALGALNNKGITEPVAQIVKTTRTGLG